MDKYTETELITLGVLYINTHKTYPAAKKWTIKSAGCSKDRVYETFGNWPNFTKKLSSYINLPAIRKPKKVENKLPEKVVHKSYTIKYLVTKYLNTIQWPNTIINKEDYIKVIGKQKYNVSKELNEPSNIITNLHKQLFKEYWYKYKGKKPHCIILNIYAMKQCIYCKEVKDKKLFYKNKSRKDGLNSYCKYCNNSKYLSTDKTKAGYNARSAIYKVRKRNSEMIWGQEGIKDFYINCPKGYHVDHIVPLRGRNVCGLHILNNLQYLPAKENLTKSNKHTSDIY